MTGVSVVGPAGAEAGAVVASVVASSMEKGKTDAADGIPSIECDTRLSAEAKEPQARTAKAVLVKPFQFITLTPSDA